jgi:multidrug resistance efflux pump
MRPGPSVEAPTHLGSHQLKLPPEWLTDEDASNHEVITSAVRGGRAVQVAAPTSYSHHSFADKPLAAYPPPRVVTERSDSAKVMARVRTESSSDALPPPPSVHDRPQRKRAESRHEERQSRSDKDQKEASRASRRSRSKSAAADLPKAPAPSPQAPAPQVRESQPQMPAGINAIDPLAVPVPPEIGPSIYSWVRRLALQADLAGADRVLRDALLDLSSSLSVSIVYPGQDGLWSLGADDEIPRDAQPLIAVATARRAVVSSHSAIIPVLTTSETVAVITLTRNPRNPAYHPVEQIAMIALAREAAAILHHLAVSHLQKQAEINADKGGLYRGEALEAHRTRGQEGVPVQLTPSWVRRTYPILVIAVLAALIVCSFLTVPTYSSGHAFIKVDGTSITAPSSGTVDKVFVERGQAVKKGAVLVRMHAATEEAELTLATTELSNAMVQYLIDRSDEQTKKLLANASARVERAKAQVDTRVVRARKDGTISDVRIRLGDPLNTGDHILTIIDPGTKPEIVALLPGKDRPHLRTGMTLQVDLVGFKKVRERVEITSVGTEVIGGNEAAKAIGAQLADSAAKQLQGGSFVIVKARLPSTFEANHETHRFYHGMQAFTEVKLKSKPFLVSLLPALEKYFPE